jgi:glycosyltransferase involved in cell wall biosynthesis
MIPVYNCLGYLQETIESVLAQNIGPENMQIVVVDDCSTDGDVGALVQSIAGERVAYLRQTENQGSLRNFETCLNLAIGHWVHILHGDDKIMPGFYQEIESLFLHYPEAGAAFTNMAMLAGDNQVLYVGEELLKEPGILENFSVQNAQKLLLQPPAIVVKRSVYEKLGAFYAVHYGEDWEMWTRIGAHYPVAYSPACLANYRYYLNNSITQRSILSGQNVRDIIKVIDIMQSYLPAEVRAITKKTARLQYALYCVNLAYSLYPTNKAAALIQARGALLLSNNIEVYKTLCKYFLMATVMNKRLISLYSLPQI